MAMSGVKLTENCNITYQEIQKSKKHRYAVFVISNGQIDVETVGNRDSSYSDFLVDLHKKDGDVDECRYGLYDYEYQFSPDGTESTFKSKLFLMSWCPDSSKIKNKMLYSSSFDTLKRAFVGVHKVIQANDKSQCDQKEVEDILRATDRI
eukprot:TRINITY_DN20673_c0_g1_i1.p1 TRINITY_DN20673_c0_g1~~TRINITY_DN20673_c0_g1_i1.p1  ORF type:complete len:150 (+),score=36.48 TRINITY_DN20673_c0_g1_i1:49-498(+)